MRKIFIIVSLILVHSLIIYAQEEANIERIQQANNAFNEGDYDKAIADYQSLSDLGLVSDGLYANMGTALLKNGEIGKSILNFEKSLLLNPGNATARNNLKLAQERVNNAVSIIPDFVLVVIWSSFVKLLNVEGWLYLHALFLLLALIGLASISLDIDYKLVSRFKMWRGAIPLTIIFLVMSLFVLYLSLSRANQLYNINYGIVMHEGTLLTNGPDQRSTEVAVLSEGVRVLVLDQINDFYKVQMDDKDEGWIKESNVELIKITKEVK